LKNTPPIPVILAILPSFDLSAYVVLNAFLASARQLRPERALPGEPRHLEDGSRSQTGYAKEHRE
jgi:hypothetical protein